MIKVQRLELISEVKNSPLFSGDACDMTQRIGGYNLSFLCDLFLFPCITNTFLTSCSQIEELIATLSPAVYNQWKTKRN